jgi:hypothetical protein
MAEESAIALFREAGLNVSSVERTFARIRQDVGTRAPKAATVAFEFRGQGRDGSDVVLPGYVRLSLNGETQELLERWSGDSATQTPFGAGVRLLPTERSLLFLFPNDDGLRGLDVMNNPSELRAALGELEDLKAHGWHITADETCFETVRYRPERRFLARGRLGLEDVLGNRSTRDVFIRYFPDDRGERIAQCVSSLLSGGDFSYVPRPLGALLDGRLFVEELIDGEGFFPAFRSGRLDPGVLATRLQLLHSSPAFIAPSDPPEDLLKGLRERLEKLFLEPALAALANEAAENLVKLVPEERPPVPIHGDLHPDQILVRSDGPWFVDFERAGMGDPYQDLGNLVAHLLRLAQWNKQFSVDLTAFTKALIDAYNEGQEPRPPSDLAFFVGRSMLVRARAALRRQEDNYLARARRELELAKVVTSRPS